MNFFATRWGKGTAGVFLACLVLAFPPAIAYVAAVFLLAWGADQLRLGFKELEHAEALEAAAGLDLPPAECDLLPGGGPALPRSPLDETDAGRGLPAHRGGARAGGYPAIVEWRAPRCSD